MCRDAAGKRQKLPEATCKAPSGQAWAEKIGSGASGVGHASPSEPAERDVAHAVTDVGAAVPAFEKECTVGAVLAGIDPLRRDGGARQQGNRASPCVGFGFTQTGSKAPDGSTHAEPASPPMADVLGERPCSSVKQANTPPVIVIGTNGALAAISALEIII